MLRTVGSGSYRIDYKYGAAILGAAATHLQKQPDQCEHTMKQVIDVRRCTDRRLGRLRVPVWSENSICLSLYWSVTIGHEARDNEQTRC